VFNIGTGEMIMIAVVALLVLGPQRLPELARGIGKFLREFRRQTDDVRNVVEREFYRMDQEVMNTPQVQAAPDAVAQGQADGAPAAAQVGAPSQPQQAELQLQAPPADESEPGHPDYHREEKPAAAAGSEPEAPAAEPPPAQKVG
jgi:sec-independent protein translocase protein TatB